MPPSGGIPPSLTKASRSAECNVKGTGSKNFPSGNGECCRSHFHPFIPAPVNPDLGEILPYIGH